VEVLGQTRIEELVQRYGFLEEYLLSLEVAFEQRSAPLEGRRAHYGLTLEEFARWGGIAFGELQRELQHRIDGGVQQTTGPEGVVLSQNQRRGLEELVECLERDGQIQPAGIERFWREWGMVDGQGMAQLEQLLRGRGFGQAQITGVMGIHVVRGAQRGAEAAAPTVPRGHPVHTLMMENRACEDVLNELEVQRTLLEQGEGQSPAGTPVRQRLYGLIEQLNRLEPHFKRLEVVLLPLVQQRGEGGEAVVHWAMHDDIRNGIAGLLALCEQHAPVEVVIGAVGQLIRMLREMIGAEEHRLYPRALALLEQAQWRSMEEHGQAFGYSWIVPHALYPARDTRSG
jgi:DUF438 domain-containing protein